MATVRITNDLRHDILTSLGSMYLNRRRNLQDQLVKLPIGNEAILAALNPKDLELARQLNTHAAWVAERTQVSVTITFTDNKGNRQKHYQAYSVNPSIPAPANLYAPDRHSIDLPTSAPSYPAAARILTDLFIIAEESKELHRSIGALLDSCSTLRQLLEVWPSALSHLPPDALRRHAMKAEKRSASREAPTVDDATKHLLIKASLLKNA